MQISKELAGFSGAKADDLRKAIGKKNRAAMAALKPEFVEGCRASGTSPEVIEFLWQTNEKSADYSFNKSHAACYALIAYRTAWLKANHPLTRHCSRQRWYSLRSFPAGDGSLRTGQQATSRAMHRTGRAAGWNSTVRPSRVDTPA